MAILATEILLIGVGLAITEGCVQTKSGRNREPSAMPGDPPPGAPVDENGSTWVGYEFVPEADSLTVDQLTRELAGTWVVGNNNGRSDRGLAWEGLIVGSPGTGAGAVTWYSSNALQESINGCSKHAKSLLQKITFSEALSEGTILLDFRFEDGSFQQHLVQKRDSFWFGRRVETQPVGVKAATIETYLESIGGSIGNGLLSKTTAICADQG